MTSKISTIVKYFLLSLYTQTLKGTISKLSPKYTPVASEWSSCSVSCGNGRTSRVVTCIHHQGIRNTTCTYHRSCWIGRCVGKCKNKTCFLIKPYLNAKHASIIAHTLYHIACTMPHLVKHLNPDIFKHSDVYESVCDVSLKPIMQINQTKK